MLLILRGKIKVTSKFTGKSKFAFWANLAINDILEFEAMVSRFSSNDITVTNFMTGEKFETTFGELYNYLQKFEAVELKN